MYCFVLSLLLVDFKYSSDLLVCVVWLHPIHSEREFNHTKTIENRRMHSHATKLSSFDVALHPKFTGGGLRLWMRFWTSLSSVNIHNAIESYSLSIFSGIAVFKCRYLVSLHHCVGSLPLSGAVPLLRFAVRDSISSNAPFVLLQVISWS